MKDSSPPSHPGGEKPVLQLKADYGLALADGTQLEEGQASLTLEKETLLLFPPFQEPMVIPLLQIQGLSAENHQFRLELAGGQTLLISRAGRQFDDLVRELTRCRHERLIQELLMGETTVAGDVPAVVAGTPPRPCRLRLTETALLVMEETGPVQRIPYCRMERIHPENYAVAITLDDETIFTLTRMGSHYDPFCKQLSRAVSQLAQQEQEALMQVMPGVPSMEIRALSSLLKDGKPVNCHRVQQISPAGWQSLQTQLARAGLEATVSFLTELATRQQTHQIMRMGLKRGLMGDTGGHTLLLMVSLLPISPDPEHGEDACYLAGGTLVLEAGGLVRDSEAETPPGVPPQTEGRQSPQETDDLAATGRATYLFAIPPGSPVDGASAQEAWHASAEKFMDQLTRWLLAVNYRREPIYLTGEQLQTPAYQRYQTALREIPELQSLRDAFVTRLFHRSRSQWEDQLMQQLRKPSQIREKQA